MDINPGPDGRFGFTIVGDCPLLVDDCLPNSPAGRSGLRAGDYVMEINGIPVKHHETAAAMIKVAQGRPLRLGVLSMRRRIKRLSHSMREVSLSGDSVRQDRAHKALEFNKKVCGWQGCVGGRGVCLHLCLLSLHVSVYISVSVSVSNSVSVCVSICRGLHTHKPTEVNRKLCLSSSCRWRRCLVMSQI